MIDLIPPIPYPSLNLIMYPLKHNPQLLSHPLTKTIHMNCYEIITCMDYCVVDSLLTVFHSKDYVGREGLGELEVRLGF